MRTILMTGLLLFAIACNNDPKLPQDVLPQKKMEAVLWDILRADEMVNLQYAKDTTINRLDSSTRLYQQVFALHATDAATFKKSFKYYQRHPELLKPVFDSLQKRGYAPTPNGPAPLVP